MKNITAICICMVVHLSVKAQWISRTQFESQHPEVVPGAAISSALGSRLVKVNSQERNAGNAGSTVNHRIDSLIWSSGDKYIYYYNNVGNPDYLVMFSSSGVPNQRTDYTYNSSAQVVQRTMSNWNSMAMQWDSLSRTVFYYSMSGVLDSMHSFSWVTLTQQWDLVSRTLRSYDASGNLILLDLLTWNTNTGQWSSYLTEAYTFNSSGLLQMQVSSALNQAGTALVPQTKVEYYYTMSTPPFPDSAIISNYNTLTQSWVLNAKDLYTLTNASTGDYYYITLVSGSPGSWVPTYKEEFYFNSLGDILQQNSYNYNTSTGSWINSNRREVTYDVTVPLSQLYVYEYYQFLSKILVDGFYSWNGTTYVLLNKADYYWSDVITGLNDLSENQGIIYPNPASEQLFVVPASPGISKFSISDLSGRQIFKQVISGKTEVDISSLKPGVYLWRVDNNSKMSSGKFVKSNY